MASALTGQVVLVVSWEQARKQSPSMASGASQEAESLHGLCDSPRLTFSLGWNVTYPFLPKSLLLGASITAAEKQTKSSFFTVSFLHGSEIIIFKCLLVPEAG